MRALSAVTVLGAVLVAPSPALAREWTFSVGASGGAGPESAFRCGEDGTLVLEGDAATKVWRCAQQPFAAAARKSYRLTFAARATGVKREAGQFSSCYVGLAFFDAQGKRIGLQVADVTAPEWTSSELSAAAPEGTARGEVWIFLSKTGRLEVRDVAVAERRPEESFSILVDDMDRKYSYFALRGADWKALAAKYRARAEAAATPDEFMKVAGEMLSELRDLHVWMKAPDGRMVTTYVDAPAENFDYKVVAKKLATVRQIAKIALVGKTQEGFGYAAVGSLQGDDAAFRELEGAIEGLFDAPGMLLDLRGNGGGDETRAQRISAMFADARHVYARSKVRSGPAHTDFADGAERTIEPRPGGKTYTRPIVCLIGPRCMSSGEGFVKMMRALPHVTLLGQPTRGASGNPAPVALPNGVTVWYSRWVDLLPDGTSPEGKGIAPDVAVVHEGPGDPTFDAAVRELARRVEGGGARK